MPVYAYRCQSCAHRFEETLSLGESDMIVLCPKCHERSSRILSAAPAILSQGGRAETSVQDRAVLADSSLKEEEATGSDSAACGCVMKACHHASKKPGRQQDSSNQKPPSQF